MSALYSSKRILRLPMSHKHQSRNTNIYTMVLARFLTFIGGLPIHPLQFPLFRLLFPLVGWASFSYTAHFYVICGCSFNGAAAQFHYLCDYGTQGLAPELLSPSSECVCVLPSCRLLNAVLSCNNNAYVLIFTVCADERNWATQNTQIIPSSSLSWNEALMV